MVDSITTDNAADILKSVKILRGSLYGVSSLDRYQIRASFLMLGIANIHNLAVKDCMEWIHDKMEKVRKLITSSRCSVKRRDFLKDINVEMAVRYKLPRLSVSTQ